MTPPLDLAREIAPLLGGLRWGIGGSLLLHHFGLETAPQDLDIVTTPEDFPDAVARLSAHLGPAIQVDHPSYASLHFARFTSSRGVNLDIMAGIRVHARTGIQSWNFNSDTVLLQDRLPWMQARDWLTLYEMFDRPERVKLLPGFLDQ